MGGIQYNMANGKNQSITKKRKICEGFEKINDIHHKKIFTDINYHKFNDNDFKEKIDLDHRYLIKFNNGIYDLKNKVFFKDKEPKDYITGSVSYDYKEHHFDY